MKNAQAISNINEILENVNIPNRHTYFQIEKFIIGKEPTSQAQLWTIVKELQARRESLICLEKDFLDLEDNIELLQIKVEKNDLDIKFLSKEEGELKNILIREKEIEIRKLLREKNNLIISSKNVNNKMKDIGEESNFLIKCYEKITKDFGEIKDLDDEESQKEMWNQKLLEEFNLRLIFRKPFDSEFVKTIMCLQDDSDVKKNMINLISNNVKNIGTK